VRLDRLPDGAQAVARLASAVGRRTDHVLLEAVAGLSERELEDALRECVAGHVLVVEDDGYRFRHALLQEVAYGELLPGERRRLHDRIAELLAERPPRGGAAGAQQLAETAHHRHLARDLPRALTAAVAAGRAAEAVHALAEACCHYELALELWDAVEAPEERAGADLAFVLERAADCRWLGLGDPHGTTRLLERALAELDADERPRRADVTSQLAMCSWNARGSARAGLPLHEQALALLDGRPSEVAARVLSRCANALLLTSDFALAEARAREAVQVARDAGARRAEADALTTLFVCRGTAGDVDATLELIAQARAAVLETLLQTQTANEVKRFYTNASHVLREFGRYEEAVATAREGIEMHARAGLNRHGQMCINENAAEALCSLGRPEEARAMLGDGQPAFTSDTMCFHLHLANIARLTGDLEAAGDQLDRLMAMPDQEPALAMLARALRADVALWRGDVAGAAEDLRAGEAVLVDADREPAARVLGVAVRAQADAAELGIVPPAEAAVEADRLLERLRRVVREGVASLPEPDMQLRQANAERARLEPGDHAATWRDVAAGWNELSRPYEAAYVSWRAACALAAGRGPREELEAALRAAHGSASGARHLLSEVERLARRARIALPGVRTDAGMFPELTSREREVLTLVAAGRTNRQIAGELFITDKTASVHVSNILGKLGVATRGEAAALAHRAGFDLEPVSLTTPSTA
jgi:DNA-binding CsgD family transcriptional regulator/tetratricopeptide (TPR) repeat protein